MIRRFAIVALLTVACGAARAEVRDVAELFPADTLAYLELTRPTETADALAALLKSSPLADSLRFTHDRLDKATDSQKASPVLDAAMAGLVAAPELLAELKRIRGAAVGLTGFTDQGEPQIASAVLLGDSHLFALAARAYLTTTPDFRRVATLDGVPVFQYRAFVGPLTTPEGKPFAPDDEDNPLKGRQPTDGTGEPTFAFTPGLFAVGSSVKAVGDVLKRYAGKANGPTLARADGFKSANRDTPGVTGFVLPAQLFAKFDATNKTAGRGADTDALAWVRFAANPKAIRRVTASVHLQPDGIGVVADIETASGSPCPLLDLMGEAPLAANFPRAASDDTALSLTFALPPTNRRSDSFLAFADSLAKANGTVGRMPSETLKAAATPDFDPAKDLFPAVTAVSLFLPAKQTLPSGGRAWPSVVIHTSDEATANRWDAATPRLLQSATGENTLPSPSAETVAGVRVLTLPGAELPWNAAVHYARGGSAVVYGLDREAVAAAANRAAKPPAGDAIDPNVVAVGVVRPATLAAAILPAERKPAAAPPGAANVRTLPDIVEPTSAPPGSPMRGEPLIVGIGRSAKHLPPVSVSVTRTGTTLRLRATQSGLAKPLGEAVKDFLLWLEAHPSDRDGPGEPPLAPQLFDN